MNGEVEAIRLLLDEGGDVNKHDRQYGNALQAAAFNGEVEAIRLFLDREADVNARGGEYVQTKLPLDEVADVRAFSTCGDALMAAIMNSNVEATKLLLHKGADINTENKYLGNELQVSARYGNIDIMWLLLDKGVDINAKGRKYGNVLQAALCNIKTIQFLLVLGIVASNRFGLRSSIIN